MQVMEQKQEIQKITIETLARSFFQESYTYGFNLSYYLRFINLLLDCALNNKKTNLKEKSKSKSKKSNIISLP
ncbi:MAG: hypothetical protein ACMUIU_01255 [bacterium]